jgi:hypothetical protein
MTKPISYKRHRFPPQIIAHAVWLYFRFPLSLRLVEEMLLERSPAGSVGGSATIYQASDSLKSGSCYKRHRQVNGLTSQSSTGSAGQKPAAKPVTSAQAVKARARALR